MPLGVGGFGAVAGEDGAAENSAGAGLAAGFFPAGAKSDGLMVGASVSTTFSATGLEAAFLAGAAGASTTGASAAGLAAAFFAVFLAGAAASVDASAPLAGGSAARSFFATGASIDEDAPLTNSPNSFNLATTTLLS
jgi:hypothetical protein